MKHECRGCKRKCKVESSAEPLVCILSGLTNFSQWHQVKEPAPKPLSEAILPKLTVEVFDLPEVKENAPWGTCAVIEIDERLWIAESIPEMTSTGWHQDGAKKRWYVAPSKYKFDASDWQNSLVKRVEKNKLPDFIKVGNYIWNEFQGRFASITAVGERIQLLDLTEQKGYMEDVDCLKPARVRPWTFEEAPYHFKTKDDLYFFVWDFDFGWGYRSSKYSTFHSLSEVAKLTQLSGEPCGVLECVNEKEASK